MLTLGYEEGIFHEFKEECSTRSFPMREHSYEEMVKNKQSNYLSVIGLTLRGSLPV